MLGLDSYIRLRFQQLILFFIIFFFGLLLGRVGTEKMRLHYRSEVQTLEEGPWKINIRADTLVLRAPSSPLLHHYSRYAGKLSVAYKCHEAILPQCALSAIVSSVCYNSQLSVIMPSVYHNAIFLP